MFMNMQMDPVFNEVIEETYGSSSYKRRFFRNNAGKILVFKTDEKFQSVSHFFRVYELDFVNYYTDIFLFLRDMANGRDIFMHLNLRLGGVRVTINKYVDASWKNKLTLMIPMRVEWLTPVPDVSGSILSLEHVTFPQNILILLSLTWNLG